MGAFFRVYPCLLYTSSLLYTAKTYGPDRNAGFSVIPAMSMLSYAAGARFLNLMGGSPLSFYDWYADLPPSSLSLIHISAVILLHSPYMKVPKSLQSIVSYLSGQWRGRVRLLTVNG